ncbi:MAG: preprotein translocase subunit SecY [Clostridiales bacterium]|nr:preprotein translocase subunit SecY [Clostridiales bacterium]
MFETIKNCFKVKEIRKKIFLTLILLLIFRLGCYIPVPGIKVSEFKSVIEGNEFLGVLSSITGGSLASATLFALGISPYINASIIIQLLTVGIPALERLSKEGEDGRKKIAQITRFVTIALAIAQAIGIIINFGINSNALNLNFFGYFSQNTELSVVSETGAKVMAGIFLTVVYTAGAMLVMWLGERITEYGVSNGISLIIFVGIISTAGLTIVDRFTEAFGWGDYAGKANPSVLWEVLGFVLLTVVEFAAIVTVDLSERKIPVQYAKQVKGRKMYGGQSSVIPIKISGSGVMPLIFAFALISFPQLLISLFWPNTDAAKNITIWFSGSSPQWYGQLIYMVTLCLLIFAFSFFYQSMQFNPEDVSKTIQQNGGFIQGIRPGKPTSDHLKKISNRITLFGAIYLSLVAFIPSILSIVLASLGQSNLTLLSVFSTTGILIVVSVALELDKQLESQLMMKTYKGFLK